MKRIIFFLLIVFLAVAITAQPLPARLKHTIIISTDCAVDDMRAISLLLSCPGITIKAILTSDGSLPPGDGAEKIGSLLHEFGRDDITVACSEVREGINPSWREFNRQISWGADTMIELKDLKAVDCLSEILKSEDEKIIIICLGPLTDMAQLIDKNAALLSKIERIIWYNESVKPLQGFNYEVNTKAADIVLSSDVRIDVISNLGKNDAYFDRAMFDVCTKSKTLLASTLFNVHSQRVVFEKLEQNHFRLCDELAVLYLTDPELFGINVMTDKLNVRYNQDYNVWGVKEAFRDMINGTYVRDRSIVFNRFPSQREMFNYDVRQIMDSAIARYGPEEWKANVLTDEFHGHLGVFSIVGAKMGIKARELFGVGTDKLEVITNAGTRPPYSCLNDGIQVSTGATLGMGTIHLARKGKVRPSAVFTYENRSVRITLKQEYLEQVEADIDEGIAKFGLMDDGYWKLIRYNALKYWLEWDRNEIFDVEDMVRKR